MTYGELYYKTDLIHKREMIVVKNGSHVTEPNRIDYWNEYYEDYEVKFIDVSTKGYLQINVR